MLVEQTEALDGSPIIHRFEWGKKEPTVIRGFTPYFFVPEETPERRIQIASRGIWHEVEEGDWIGLDGVRLKKITVATQLDVYRLRNSLKHYCADVPFIWRYLWDLTEVPQEQKPTVLHTDIEVITDGKKFPHAELAEKPIACISNKMTGRLQSPMMTLGWHPTWDKRTIKSKDQHIHLFGDEASMMEEYVRLFRKWDPEVITGWNVVGFDLTYILNRLDKLGIDSSQLSPLGQIANHEKGNDEGKRTIMGRTAFDLDSAYLAFQARKFESNKLERVAQRELGAHLKKRINANNTEAVWNESPRTLLQYNSEDVDWTVGIDKKLGLVDTFVEMSWVTGCPLKDTINLGKALEFWLIKKIPRVPFSTQEKNGDLEGADIMDPEADVHEWLVGIDIVSAYPNSAKTFNIGHNTWRRTVDSNISLGTGLNFAQHGDEISILTPPIDDLFYMKDDYGDKKKTVPYGSDDWFNYDRRRYAYKRLLNTVYGLTGFRGRWYFLPVANGITAACRAIIGYARGVCENNLNYPVVASHTDALYFKSGITTRKDATQDEIDEAVEQTVAIGNAACDAINADVDNLATSLGVKDLSYNSIEFGFEKVARRAIFKNKNYYALKMAWVDGSTFTPEQIAAGDDIEIKGFGAIKSDNSKLSKALQSEVLTMIINGREKDEVLARIQHDVDRIRAGKITVEDVGVPSSIKRPIHTYKVKRQEHKAALWSNEHLGKEYGAKSKPYVVFTKGRTRVVALDPDDELPKGLVFDKETIVEKLVRKKVDDIVEIAGFNARQMKLGGF